jgi:hypothetical protein
MKKLIASTLAIISLSACTANKPLTEEDQAMQYNMTVSEFREQKQAAARMNMSFEEHMKHMDHTGM